jgi:nucleoside 2-deoxyribosyltransferase
MKRVIYFAAPLFTQAERMWNRTLSETMLRKSSAIEIFLPQEETKKAITENGVDFKKIQEICLRGIDTCDHVLAILDGSDSDSGTCFECGYGFALGKKIVGVRTDIRSGEDQGLNAMLNQSCKSVIQYSADNDSETDLDKLAEKIIKELDKIES